MQDGGILDRALGSLRRRGIVHRELARRSRDAVRRPIVIVPGVMGVRLADDRGRIVWGSTRSLFVGPGPAEVERVRTADLLDSFPIVPRVLHHDVFGGLVRYLERVYGARRDRDLFALDHDWRAPLADGARALARLVARIRGASEVEVDLVAICSGGPLVRTFLAGGWSDDPVSALADPVLGEAARSVRRVVYLGAPLRGTFSAFQYMQTGVTPVWGARHQPAAPFHATCRANFDLMPHDGERLFCDRDGTRLDLDHLDPRTWRELGLVGADRPELAHDLARAKANHALVAAAEPQHPSSIAIADRHLRATARAIVESGKLVLPCDEQLGHLERYPFAFEPGDGLIPAATMAAAPNQPADGPWWTELTAHDRVATDPHVHPLVVEALLTPHKPVPRERYLWPRNPETRGVVPA